MVPVKASAPLKKSIGAAVETGFHALLSWIYNVKTMLFIYGIDACCIVLIGLLLTTRRQRRRRRRRHQPTYMNRMHKRCPKGGKDVGQRTGFHERKAFSGSVQEVVQTLVKFCLACFNF
jgi:hypothetical protein